MFFQFQWRLRSFIHDCRYTQNRYEQFNLAARVFAYLKEVKRAGGAYPDFDGDLAVHCPCCPHEGINIPLDWHTAAPQQR